MLEVKYHDMDSVLKMVKRKLKWFNFSQMYCIARKIPQRFVTHP
jgi:hypothetical protein